MSTFDDASLVMIPSGYKASKVYSVKPTDGTGDLVFTRSLDTATRVGPDGLIEKVRTNLVLHSQEFTNAAWAKNGLTITGGQTDPNGGTNAFLATATATSSSFFFQTTSTASCVSVFAKAGTRSKFSIINGLFANGAEFNLATQTTIVSNAGSLAKIESVGDGWFRCSVFLSSITDAIIALDEVFGGGVTIGQTMSFAFAQQETGDIATPYIPTTTAAVSVGMLANVPRLDYYDTTCPHLLLEPQRTNLTKFSEELNNAYWNKTGSTASANVAVSPDGFTNADLLTESATFADHAFFDVVTYFVSGTTFTLSFFAKANGRTKVEVLSANSNTCPKGRFDLVEQTAVGTDGSFGAKIESYGNGWFRCSVSRVAPNTGLDVPFHAMVQSFGTISYAGNGTSGVFFYGMQTEVGSYATSYIPTLGAAVTRSDDAASKTGISALIGQTEGTIFFDLKTIANGEFKRLSINNGAFTNSIFFDFDNTNLLFAKIINGATTTHTLLSNVSIANTEKIAFAYKANDFAFFVNGNLVASEASGSVPSGLSVYEFSLAGNQPFEGTINQALLFKTRLTNAQLAELTA